MRCPLDLHLELAVNTVVKSLILNGLWGCTANKTVPLEMAAATLSWAIYVGAKEWLEFDAG